MGLSGPCMLCFLHPLAVGHYLSFALSKNIFISWECLLQIAYLALFFFFFVSMHINGYFVFSLNSYKTSIHCPHFQIVFYRVLFTAGVQIVGHMPTELNLPGVSRQNF